MEEQTNFQKLESGIEKNLSAQIRSSILKLLLNRSDTTTFADLVKLTESGKFGPVAKTVKLQELLDAYAEASKLVPESSVEAATTTKKKGSSKSSGSKKEGSKPQQEVELKEPEQKEAYYDKVAAVVRSKQGGETAASEVEDQCFGTKSQVRAALRELVVRGLVVQNGKARATRYFWRADASEEVLQKFEAFLSELKDEKRAEFEPTPEVTESE